MENQELFYRLALNLVNGIGPVKYKKLIATFQTAENIFKQSFKSLKKTDLLTEANADAIKSFKDFNSVEKELNYTEKHGIHIRCFDDATYPQKLKNCLDSPVLLFQKGNANLNAQRVLSVIGTRSFTEYGKKICEELIAQLKPYHVVVTSG
ncbi:MAG TPA: DNA-processing protein DprA, partial [Chitinophagaceae bacterium]|nr:DNA-processing protein DprA [Chitinophagaceae bacterium]